MGSDIRECLNRMRWHESYDFDQVRVWYLNRGSPGERTCISGADIIDLESHFVLTEQGAIPYHRILSIRYAGRTIFPD
ncbi:MAG: RNA repair domain-containing protein [Candidatus Thermoplasmatota archaeon]|nr:RNA repair domain-containing protein [Candidatus Thermoplasmatota archaeon]